MSANRPLGIQACNPLTMSPDPGPLQRKIAQQEPKKPEEEVILNPSRYIPGKNKVVYQNQSSLPVKVFRKWELLCRISSLPISIAVSDKQIIRIPLRVLDPTCSLIESRKICLRAILYSLLLLMP